MANMKKLAEALRGLAALNLDKGYESSAVLFGEAAAACEEGDIPDDGLLRGMTLEQRRQFVDMFNTPVPAPAPEERHGVRLIEPDTPTSVPSETYVGYLVDTIVRLNKKVASMVAPSPEQAQETIETRVRSDGARDRDSAAESEQPPVVTTPPRPPASSSPEQARRTAVLHEHFWPGTPPSPTWLCGDTHPGFENPLKNPGTFTELRPGERIVNDADGEAVHRHEAGRYSFRWRPDHACENCEQGVPVIVRGTVFQRAEEKP